MVGLKIDQNLSVTRLPVMYPRTTLVPCCRACSIFGLLERLFLGSFIVLFCHSYGAMDCLMASPQFFIIMFPVLLTPISSWLDMFPVRFYQVYRGNALAM